MSDLPIQFPVLALVRDPGDNSEVIACIRDADGISDALRWELKRKPLLGALLVEVAGRCWRVRDMIILSLGATGWRRALNLIARYVYRVRYEVDEEAPLPFETIKERVQASIVANWGYWRDDELVAGEDGPPRDEQEMLEDLLERVGRTSDVRALIETLESWPD